MDHGHHNKSFTYHPTTPGTFHPQHASIKIGPALMAEAVQYPLPTGTLKAHRFSATQSPSRVHMHKRQKVGGKSSAPVHGLGVNALGVGASASTNG